MQFNKLAIKLLTLFFLIWNIPEVSAQQVMKNSVNSESIKSIQLHREGWKLSYPIAELNSDAGLVLSFDDLTSEVRTYSYKLIHCDANWNPSPLSESEFIDGSVYNQIYDYKFSFNTYTSYIHYELKMPNDDFSFKISGNYVIVVYDNFNEDDVIFTQRFMITEKLVDIDAVVKRPVLSEFRNSHQEVDFNINYGYFNIEDPYNDIRVLVLQNGRWDNAIDDLKPLFTRTGVLEYDYQQENLFPGINEFRWFDIKSLRYQSPYIKDVVFDRNNYYVELFPDQIRANKVYFYEEDINGKYYVEVQEEQNNETDSEYVYVDFSLPLEAPLTHGELYVAGALTNWTYTEDNRMEYDLENKEYRLRLLLKQGYYNYMYGLVLNNSAQADLGYIEGNYYETENDYIILVYHKGTTSRYQRLIGFQIVNSLHQK